MKKAGILLLLAAGLLLQTSELQPAQAAQAPAAVGAAKAQGAPGMRRPQMSREKAIFILHENYGFDQALLEKQLSAGIEYRELNTLCLYAYLAKKPLEEVTARRELYTWERLKLALGLTPQKFYDRKIEYQADRLLARMGIDRKLTIKYMKLGFPMHHVNMAALLAQKCDAGIYEIMCMKTPKNTWNDVALQLGLTVEACQEVKDKITKAFKR